MSGWPQEFAISIELSSSVYQHDFLCTISYFDEAALLQGLNSGCLPAYIVILITDLYSPLQENSSEVIYIYTFIYMYVCIYI